VNRYPALVLAAAWCTAIAASLVLLPAQPAVGAMAIALAVPCMALAVVLRPALVALTVAVALLGVSRAELPAVDPLTPSRAAALAGQVMVVTGRVADDGRYAAGGSEVLVEPHNLNIGNLVVRWRGPTEVAFGDEVRAVGKISFPRDMPAFDRRAYLAQRHVYVELHATNIDVVSSGSGPAALPGWLRARYTETLNRALAPPHAGILLGIVLGIHQGIPTALQNALIATGLIHLLVLSGLKVAVFARVVQGALHPMLGRHSTWPALGLIALYAMVGGATPAAVRAAAMGGLAIAAAHLGRPTHVWTSLALVAGAMLAWHPELAWDVGFQLSFAGTAAIVLLTPPLAARLEFIPHVIREPFAVTCAAQVGTLPMMATDFHVLSPVAPLANALTLPILPLLVGGGLLLGTLSFLPDLARFAALPLTGLLAYIEQIAYLFERVPAAAFSIPRFPTWAGLAYYAAVGPAVLAAHLEGRRRTAAIAASVLAPALISTTALAIWANAPPQAIVMAVGDGQAVLLRGPQGVVLIDGGPSPAKLKDELGAQLPPWQRKLDAVVITAPSLGHVGGFAGFDRPTATVLLPEAGLAGSAWRTAAFEAVARGASIQRIRAGQVITIAGFEIQVLWPEANSPGDQVGAAYVGLRAVAPDGRSFCDLSDLDPDAQTQASTGLRGKCTYLLLPSGGRSRLSPELERAALTPTTRLIASRASGRLANGFPPSVLRTDQEGTITLPL
jgi:competence protein ComEC